MERGAHGRDVEVSLGRSLEDGDLHVALGS
jgi:hypothetical protein